MIDSKFIELILIASLLTVGQAAGSESDHGPAWLGIVVGGQDTEGLEIAAIVPGGPAYMADLRIGDLLQAVDGEAISDWNTLEKVVGKLRIGTAVEIEFLRGSKRMSRSVIPGDRSNRNLRFLPEPATGIRTAVPAPEIVGDPDSGISLVPISPELREHYGAPSDAGILVVAVDKGSAAEVAGMRVGDVLVRGGGAVLRSPGDLQEQLLRIQPDGRLEVDTVREGEVMKVLLTVPTVMGVRNSREIALEKEIRLLENRVRELEEALRKSRED